LDGHCSLPCIDRLRHQPKPNLTLSQVTHGETGEEMQVPFRRVHLSDPDPNCQYLDIYDTR
jgi:hypothetical protein